MRNGSAGDGAGRPEMRTATPVRLSRATAERLLDGGPGPADLRHLLDAAAGPAAPGEVAGEAAALAAFAAAAHHARGPGESARRPSMLGTALSKILATKALAAAVLVAGATGGVAVATHSAGLPADPPAVSTPVPAVGPDRSGGDRGEQPGGDPAG
ncbi:MAG TPA: hypothetical protein VEZ42_02065, partial [Pseudonocardia sp.]|nr:hypothetical protein [Pseudonocardia sp.]